MARLPNLGEGQGRDDVAYRFGCWLVRDLALSDSEALTWLTDCPENRSANKLFRDKGLPSF
jgi:hypothetical protein